MLRMLGDIDSIAVVCHMNRSVRRIDLHFKGSHGKGVGFSIGNGLRLPNNVVAHIHHPFIEEFVKSGNVGDGASGEQGGGSGGRSSGGSVGGGGGGGGGGRRSVHDIFDCLSGFNCSDICVRFFKNMFDIGHFLVFLKVFCSSSDSGGFSFRRFGRHCDSSRMRVCLI